MGWDVPRVIQCERARSVLGRWGWGVLRPSAKEAIKVKRLKSVRQMWKQDQNDNNTMAACIFDKCEIDMT
jgi:hypothetical protein